MSIKLKPKFDLGQKVYYSNGFFDIKIISGIIEQINVYGSFPSGNPIFEYIVDKRRFDGKTIFLTKESLLKYELKFVSKNIISKISELNELIKSCEQALNANKRSLKKYKNLYKEITGKEYKEDVK